ncbi:MAG: eIF2 kinase Gcn2p negative regulator, partial [Watsoniomyces obsoletus]
MQSCNEALNDEIAALNSIYGDATVAVASSSLHETSAVLRPPDIHFSFLLSFPSEYPDVPPQIRGTNSTGSSGRGEGETAVNTLRQVLGSVYRPGQVCLFDLLEEAGPLLLVHNHDSVEDTAQATPD